MATRSVTVVAVASLALALAAAFSCKTFDLPSETCNPDGLDATRSRGDGCSRCLEDRCCDVVGRCERQAGCAPLVQEVHRCVVSAERKGASAESECAKRLPDLREADDAYRCMRASCGASCGLPVCKVDKAAPLIRNAKCDGCFAGGCCVELNRCYEDRACKLMLECMVHDCGGEFGPALNSSGGLSLLPVAETLCRDPSASAGAPRCVVACLCRYRDNDQGLPPIDPALLPFNLARSVYECGRTAQCGDDCSRALDDADAAR